MSKTTIAIVTGAASGIGRATAKILKDRGCTVFCCDSNQVLLEEQFGPVDEEDVGPGGAGAVTNGSAASVPFSSPKHGGSAPNSPGRCNGNPLTGVCFSVVLDVTSASSLRAARDRISEIIKTRILLATAIMKVAAAEPPQHSPAGLITQAAQGHEQEITLILFNNAGVGYDVPKMFFESAKRFLKDEKILTFEEHILGKTKTSARTGAEENVAAITMAVNFYGALRAMGEDFFLGVCEGVEKEVKKAKGASGTTGVDAGANGEAPLDARLRTVLHFRIVCTGSGGGRANMGRLLLENDIPTRAPVPPSAKKLQEHLLQNTTDFGSILQKDAVDFQIDFDYTLDLCKRRWAGGKGESIIWPRYGEAEGKGYYLSSYGFSKACLHQALRVLVNSNAPEALLVAASTESKENPTLELLTSFQKLHSFVHRNHVPVCALFPGVIKTAMTAPYFADTMPGLMPPESGAGVLVHYGLDFYSGDMLHDNKNDRVLYNAQLKRVDEYFERVDEDSFH